MEEIGISRFQANCSRIIERVRKTGKPIRIIRFGKAVAEIMPPPGSKEPGEWLGCMEGTIKITGDIVGPVCDPNDCEVLRDEGFPESPQQRS